ncbi:MAG: U32 family peptidase [Erysipelotrichaceae bacterium]|nr:U32 family peptidase [Erysipelotrichaceae bacterium]
MQKVELLSPAGNYECMVAAVQAGCNAVYLSGKAFGARSFAGNFDNEELLKAVNYCHLHQVKVYVTVNTIVLESEFKELNNYLKLLSDINVDAVIVQDLGVLRFIKKNYSTLEVHASTQMNVFNKNGALILKQLGVSRVVLARETDIETVKEISNTGIEIEIFIHGALCFSSSGNCLMSSVIGRRSGNRGKCAQPCRKLYSIYEDDYLIEENKSILSTKDLMTLDHLNVILESEVRSLKIEGRMKSPEYVYTVTKAYRDAIDEYYKHHKYVISNKTNDNILVTFNRSFTKGYLLGDDNFNIVNKEYVNHRGIVIGKVINARNDFIEIKLRNDISLHDGLRVLSNEEYGVYLTNILVNNNSVKKATKNQVIKLFIKNNSKIGDLVVKTSSSNLTSEIKEILKKENVKFKINLDVSIFCGKKLSIRVFIDNYSFIVYGDYLEYGEQVLSIDRIKEQLSKLSSTVYEVDKINIKTDNISFVKVSELNELRRSFVNVLNEYLLSKKDKVNPKYLLNNNLKEFIKKPLKIECVTSTNNQKEVCEKFNIEAVFALNREYGGRINSNNLIFTHNIGNITDKSIISPYFNIVNKEALNTLIDLGIKDCYLSPEIDFNTINDLDLNNLNINVGMIVYGRIDLMVSKHCVIGNIKGAKNKNCNACKKHSYKIKDDYGNNYPLLLEKENDCTMRILDNHKLNLINYLDKLKELGINKFLLVFTDENELEVMDILETFINGKKINGKLYTGFINEKIM